MWHHVVAEYIKNAVTLTVDGASPKVGVGGDVMSLGLRNELYIGGIPGVYEYYCQLGTSYSILQLQIGAQLLQQICYNFHIIVE
jgi:hypothetical protein